MIGKLIVFGVIIVVILLAIKFINNAGKPPKDDGNGGNGDKETVNLKQDDDGTYRSD